ncbi:MAG: hypothetical protein HRF50_00800 [Phycisphaerae bacterium]
MKAENSADEDRHALAQRVSARIATESANRLRSHPTALAVISLAADVVESASSLAAGSPDRPRQACRVGCSWCCHMAVSVTAPEALLIVDRLRETLPPEGFAEAVDRIRETSKQVSHLTLERRAAARVPCALLGRAGECTVHWFRPIGCRAWTSLSAAACEQAFLRDQPGHASDMDRTAWAVGNAVTEGLERGIRDRGLDAGQFELHSVVLRAIEAPDAALRWARGEPVFEGCARVTSDALRAGCVR